MGTSTTTADNQLKLILQAVTWANIAINATSSPATNLYVALHTADPGVGGTQSTNECTYTGYARVAVVRTSSGWAVTTNSGSPVADITFPNGSGGSGTATYWSIGMSDTGVAGIILWSGPISPTIITGSGVQPSLTTASTIVVT